MSCVTLLLRKKMSPRICKNDWDTPTVCDNMGDVLKSFMRWKSLFTTENEKGATERNEIVKLHKSKDWLKLVTYWVKTVTITHTRTNSSAVTHLLSMLGWDMTGAHHSGNQPQLQGWSSALSEGSVHRVVPPTKGSQGDGEPLSPACCSLNWALDSQRVSVHNFMKCLNAIH